MQWLVFEHLNGNRITVYGPFPSQDQAMSYAEHCEERIKTNWNGPMWQFTVGTLTTPAFMPERIHG